jgi:hypothetical protein
MVSAVAVRAMARRQRAVDVLRIVIRLCLFVEHDLSENRDALADRAPTSLHCFQANSTLLPRREPKSSGRIDVLLPLGGTTMRWKISRHGHDPRQIDLLAVLALLIVIVAAYEYFGRNTEVPSNSAFIVPSQSVRW